MTFRIISTLTGRTLGTGTLTQCRDALKALTSAPGALYAPGTLDLKAMVIL